MNAPTRINIEPIIWNINTVSPRKIIPSTREITGANNSIVAAFERLMYFSPQYQVSTYRNSRPPEIVM